MKTMIADDVVQMIYDKIYKIYKIQREEDRAPVLCVYMGMDVWHDMMSELQGQISSSTMTLINSNGEVIVGCKIYRVLGSHGIKVYEV